MNRFPVLSYLLLNDATDDENARLLCNPFFNIEILDKVCLACSVRATIKFIISLLRIYGKEFKMRRKNWFASQQSA